MCFQDASLDEGQEDDTDELGDDGGSEWEYEEGSEYDDDSE